MSGAATAWFVAFMSCAAPDADGSALCDYYVFDRTPFDSLLECGLGAYELVNELPVNLGGYRALCLREDSEVFQAIRGDLPTS